MNLPDLKKPFPPQDIEWRIQQSGVTNGKPWAMVLAYITNRAIMDRLDEVCGPEKWENRFEPAPSGGVLCCIKISFGDGTYTEKWDGAEQTEIEAVKGGLSGAMKRAAVQWGIGRYLYHLEAAFADIREDGKYRGEAKDKSGNKIYFKWNPPALPAWALPEGHTPAPQSPRKPEQPKPASTGGEDGKKPQEALMDELMGYCEATGLDPERVLYDVSNFEDSKNPGKFHYLEIDKVAKTSDKWAGSALKNLRLLVKKKKDIDPEDIPF